MLRKGVLKSFSLVFLHIMLIFKDELLQVLIRAITKAIVEIDRWSDNFSNTWSATTWISHHQSVYIRHHSLPLNKNMIMFRN